MSRASKLAVAAAGLLVAGCVTSTQATRLQKDLDDVKRQLFQMQQDSATSRTQIEEAARRLAGAPAADPTVQADLRAAIQSLLDQTQALSETMEEIKTRIAGLSQEIQAIRSSGRSGSGGAPPPGGADAGQAPPAGPGEQLFRTAYSDYSKGNYDLALMGFQDFLKSGPAVARAGEAEYWIGECLFSQGRFAEAVEALDRSVLKAPRGDRAPAALLKKGYAQIEAGETSQAVTTLQRLIAEHPRSEEAKLATERLRQMGLRAG